MDNTTEKTEAVEIKIGDKSFSFLLFQVSTMKKPSIFLSLEETGYITLDTGFKNTGSTTSSITYIDGANGILEHRGYRIEELASRSTFQETIYLLLHGELPPKSSWTVFKGDLASAATDFPKEIRTLLDAMPDETHPMGMLGAVLNVLTGYFTEASDSWSNEEVRWKTIHRAIAFMSETTAYIYRRKQGLPYIDPKPELGYVSNFLYMMFGEVDEKVAEALDTLLILHADHEQRSAASARFVGSSR